MCFFFLFVAFLAELPIYMVLYSASFSDLCLSLPSNLHLFFFFSEPGDALKDAVLLVVLALLLIYMYMCVFVRQWEVFTVKPRFQRTPVEEYCLSGSRHRALKKLVSEAKEVLFSPLKAQRRHRLS